jgi:hypothetical protein
VVREDGRGEKNKARQQQGKEELVNGKAQDIHSGDVWIHYRSGGAIKEYSYGHLS